MGECSGRADRSVVRQGAGVAPSEQTVAAPRVGYMHGSMRGKLRSQILTAVMVRGVIDILRSSVHTERSSTR